MLKSRLAFLKDGMHLSTTSMAFYNYFKAHLFLSTKQGVLVFFFLHVQVGCFPCLELDQIGCWSM
jgi:hypothetical protein